MATFSVAPPRAEWLLCPVNGAWGPEVACSGLSQFGDLRLHESMGNMSGWTLSPVTQRIVRIVWVYSSILPRHPKPEKLRRCLLSVIDVLMSGAQRGWRQMFLHGGGGSLGCLSNLYYLSRTQCMTLENPPLPSSSAQCGMQGSQLWYLAQARGAVLRSTD